MRRVARSGKAIITRYADYFVLAQGSPRAFEVIIARAKMNAIGIHLQGQLHIVIDNKYSRKFERQLVQSLSAIQS